MELPCLQFLLFEPYLFLLCIIGLALVHHKHSYWSKRGVPCGSCWKLWFKTVKVFSGLMPFWWDISEQYNELASHKLGGGYLFGKPTLILRDPQLILSCLVNNFSSFHDRNPEPDPISDQLSSNLFQLVGQKWHQVRQKVGPAFSTIKLKVMLHILKDCAQELDQHLKSQCSTSGEAAICVKHLMTNYTMDVIGACAMGIKCNTIQDPDCRFKKVLDAVLSYDARRHLYFALETVWPGLPRLLGFKAVRREVEEFFRTIVRDTMEMKRQQRGGGGAANRKDFLQILMNLQDNEQVEEAGGAKDTRKTDGGPMFTEDILVGLMSVFLSAGFEPVACTVTFCLYELALHPSIQEKLHDEIQKVTGETCGDFSFEDLKKLLYMEQVINETLRKHPVVTVLERICNEPVTLPDTSVEIEKGVYVFIPVMNLHLDEKYFPDPEKFDPDRFSKENVEKIVPGSYLPFGDGPRSCIASRLAIMKIKTMLITMISNYKILPCERTPKRIEYDNSRYMLNPPKNGLVLKIQERK